MKLLDWDIYEISSEKSSLNGVMLRGRIRKLGIESGFNVLVENTEDVDNRVRFAVLNDGDAGVIKDYLVKVVADASIRLLERDVNNPVLSKVKVNNAERYTL